MLRLLALAVAGIVLTARPVLCNELGRLPDLATRGLLEREMKGVGKELVATVDGIGKLAKKHLDDYLKAIDQFLVLQIGRVEQSARCGMFATRESLLGAIETANKQFNPFIRSDAVVPDGLVAPRVRYHRFVEGVRSRINQDTPVDEIRLLYADLNAHGHMMQCPGYTQESDQEIERVRLRVAVPLLEYRLLQEPGSTTSNCRTLPDCVALRGEYIKRYVASAMAADVKASKAEDRLKQLPKQAERSTIETFLGRNKFDLTWHEKTLAAYREIERSIEVPRAARKARALQMFRTAQAAGKKAYDDAEWALRNACNNWSARPEQRAAVRRYIEETPKADKAIAVAIEAKSIDPDITAEVDDVVKKALAAKAMFASGYVVGSTNLKRKGPAPTAKPTYPGVYCPPNP